MTKLKDNKKKELNDFLNKIPKILAAILDGPEDEEIMVKIHHGLDM